MKPWLLCGLTVLSMITGLSCRANPCRTDDPSCNVGPALELLRAFLLARPGLADSGQTICYDTAGAVIGCDDVSWPRQDGSLVSPAPRDLLGPLLRESFPSDHYTVDRVTRLVWKTCAQGQSGADCSAGSPLPYTNDNGVGSATEQCNSLNVANGGAGYAGRTDWRLPSMSELLTINDFGRSNPSLDPVYFPGSTSGFFWSSTTDIDAVGYSFAIQFIGGFADSYLSTNPQGVRCVAGNPLNKSSYTSNSNGTVTDLTYGLMWQKCLSGQTDDAECSGTYLPLSWQAALQYCRDLTLAGFADWRLPSVVELNSVLDRSLVAGLDTSVFPANPSIPQWTSTTVATTNNNAWRVEFPGTVVSSDYDKTDTFPVRCVRSP